jgi:hypothetical protein
VKGQSLNLPMDELRSYAGDYLGWGRGPLYGDEAWDAKKLSRIDQLVRTALRMVYFEAAIDGRAPHPWSWLTPLLDLTLASGDRYAALPLDFGGFAEHELVVTTSSGSGVGATKIPVRHPSQVLAAFASRGGTPTGRPLLAAVDAITGTGNDHGNRERLAVFPAADQAYRLRARYHFTAPALTEANPFAYGGAEMAETYKYAVRSAAERELDNLRPGEGPEWGQYQACLKSAVLRDGRHQPKTLGKNADRSDPASRATRGWGGGIGWLDNVTVEGVEPDDY